MRSKHRNNLHVMLFRSMHVTTKLFGMTIITMTLVVVVVVDDDDDVKDKDTI